MFLPILGYSRSLLPRQTSAALGYIVRHCSTWGSSLRDNDPQIYSLIRKEEERQRRSISLIASENFAQRSVLEALGSVLTNKYAEGYPGSRYYGGTSVADEVESLCQARALAAFHLDPSVWGVNVQVYSGSPANFAVYTALLNPGDRIFSLDLPHGGHLSHGFQTAARKVSAVAKYYQCIPYFVNTCTGLIDYDELESLADQQKPKMVIAGASAYPRLMDYKRFREICDKSKALLLVDMAHIAGLIAAQVIPSPFDFADVVTTTTHKTLRGPRGALIFYNKTRGKGGAGRKINATVFPGLQGGPHLHTISAIATALLQANRPEFVTYQKQVIKNIQTLGDALTRSGEKIRLVTGGTDTHLILCDLSETGVTGGEMEAVCEAVDIVLNKNTLPTVKAETSAMNPSGIRIGAPAMTSRGLKEADFTQIADLCLQALRMTKEIKRERLDASASLKDFVRHVKEESSRSKNMMKLKKEVNGFANQFPLPSA